MKKYFLGNHRYMSYFGFLALVLLFGIEIYYASPYAASWDQVDFAFALDRYDLLAMQPHFPGYPYFVLGGMLVHSFVANPAKALSVFNVMMLASASVPIFLLATQYSSKEKAWIVTVLVQSASYVVLICLQPMSDGAALAVLWWYLWAIERAKTRLSWHAQLLSLFVFSLLLGIRLSYASFALAFAFVWYEDWRKYRKISRLLLFIFLAAMFQSIWIIGVAMTEGGLMSFIKLAFSFTNGHFQEWGGTAATDQQSLWERTSYFLFHNMVWIGLSSRTFVLLTIYIALFVWTFYSVRRFSFPRWLLICVFMYGIWALFAQNIEKPRHALPIVHFLLFYGWLRFLDRGMPTYKKLFALAVLVIQLVVGTWNLREQALHLPATYQLAYDLQQRKERFVLYTWEEARVLEYLRVTFPYEQALHFSFFLQHQTNYPHAKIYITDHVVKGFQSQGVLLTGHLRKIKTYDSSKLADPVYGKITLYEWKD
ncbi:nucleoporin-interacting protein [Anoxybacillus rupiensis]|uniref:Nucleoporin-interacting protein n=1 Tax=Anoxybacteroides rupiense TaxID=311460 RepID=A0ABD5IS18_9BACL|nr:nucleoporin-interacting protein [Anoxybacillus rupiensis]